MENTNFDEAQDKTVVEAIQGAMQGMYLTGRRDSLDNLLSVFLDMREGARIPKDSEGKQPVVNLDQLIDFLQHLVADEEKSAQELVNPIVQIQINQAEE